MSASSRILLGVSVCAILAFSCGGDGGTAPPAAPKVSGVSATAVTPGDTLVIAGSNFEKPVGNNRVKFASALAVKAPFAGNSTQLRVVVDRDAVDGPITVTSNGLSANGPALTVSREVGDVLVYDGLGSGKTLALPNPTATTQYLVIPHATNPDQPYNLKFSYQISSEAAVPLPAPAENGTTGGTFTRRERFEAWRWEQTQEMVDRFGFPRPEQTPAAPGESAPLATRQFNVLKTATGAVDDPGSYQRITAQLRYTGSKCLVYADVDTLPTGNLAQSDFNALGQDFNSSIEPTDVTYFGGHSDVDVNGKVIIVISPVVNRMTPPGSNGFIAGFFLSIDLYSSPPAPSGTTNQGEFLYLLAADPGSFWGNPFPVSFTSSENIGTSAHELQHLISFSRRLFVEKGPVQLTWLEEGMAHMAEDLNGDNRANQARGRLYRGLPDSLTVSLEDEFAPLEQRGGIYLFLRLMVDRYGTGILKRIVQSKCTGRQCIESVTGAGFYDLFAEFLAAQYLSGTGLTDDPAFTYQTIDLADFGPLATTSHLAGDPGVTGEVVRTEGRFHIFSGVLGTETRLTFTNPGGGARLRHVVVRIQ